MDVPKLRYQLPLHMQLWTHFINRQKHTCSCYLLTKWPPVWRHLTKQETGASEFLAKHQVLLPTDGGPSSVDGQCCNIHSPYWVLQTETFWVSVKMLLLLQWSAGFVQLTQFTSLVAGADASVEAVILLKSSVHVCVCAFYKFVCSLTCSVTVAVCVLVWIVPHAVQICSMSFVLLCLFIWEDRCIIYKTVTRCLCEHCVCAVYWKINLCTNCSYSFSILYFWCVLSCKLNCVPLQ